MDRKSRIIVYGIILWLVPFISGFPFVDAQGNFTISETFFKTIMILVGSVVSVILAVKYFKNVEGDYVREGIMLGFAWMIINWTLDLILVYVGFFPMGVTQYYTDIGLRYLCMPIYTIGMGHLLEA